MNTKYSIKETVVAIILCASLIAIGAMWASHTQKAEADVVGPFGQGSASFLVSPSGTNVAAGQLNATTTKTSFLPTTASSSLSGLMVRGDQIDVKFRAIASSSLATLRFQVLGSDDNVDFYPVDFGTTTTMSLTSGPLVGSWSLSTSTGPTCGVNEVCREITFKNFYSKYYRILVSVEGASAAVWAKAVVREYTPR